MDYDRRRGCAGAFAAFVALGDLLGPAWTGSDRVAGCAGPLAAADGSAGTLRAAVVERGDAARVDFAAAGALLAALAAGALVAGSLVAGALSDGALAGAALRTAAFDVALTGASWRTPALADLLAAGGLGAVLSAAGGRTD